MALNRKIAKDAFDKLPDVLKTEYKVSPSDQNAYILQTEGDEDKSTALQTALDNERKKSAEYKTKIDASEEAVRKAKEDEARKSGDLASIEKSWSDKYEALKKENKTELDGLTSKLHTSFVSSAAERIAAEISTAPALLAPHIQKRLTLDLSGSAPITRVLGSDGKASALSLDDLKKEFQTNKEYASVMIASKASGAGGLHRQNGTGGPFQQRPLSTDGKPLSLAQLSPKDLANEIAARRAEQADGA